MKILSIETSCDETGIAVLEVKGKKNPQFFARANEVSSQVEIHRPYGGVYPSLAKREHIKNLPIVLKRVLKHAKVEPLHIDAIALTVGPGLDPCLWAGIEFAKKLAAQWNVPIIPVDHVEGHLIISLLSQGNSISLAGQANFQFPIFKTSFPAIALIVSGGHTQLVLVKKIGDYQIIGETLDDAAGECFDKTARILGLPYPGGPSIAKLAAETCLKNRGVRAWRGAKRRVGGNDFEGRFPKPKLPRPMIHTKNYNFSFSGLKTAVLYNFQAQPKKVQKSKEYISAMAKEIQQTVVDVLLAKTLRAAQEYDSKSIILGGGVAANKELRKQMQEHLKIVNCKLKIAPAELCTDNGLMIALAGYFNWQKKHHTTKYETIVAQPNLRLQ